MSCTALTQNYGWFKQYILFKIQTSFIKARLAQSVARETLSS
jgi:hypothetical protein